MVKGVNISFEMRSLIWRRIVLDHITPTEVYWELFRSNHSVISLKRLRDLSHMFKTPRRSEEARKYLSEVKRRGNPGFPDTREIDFNMRIILERNPVWETIEFFESKMQELRGQIAEPYSRHAFLLIVEKQ